jgi:hypothetical protein
MADIFLSKKIYDKTYCLSDFARRTELWQTVPKKKPGHFDLGQGYS